MPLKQMPTAPQPANIDLNLPDKFPPLPDDVVARFPSLKDWQAAVDNWYETITTILGDLQTNNSGVLNGTAADVATLQEEVAALQPGAYAAGSPVGDRDHPWTGFRAGIHPSAWSKHDE